MNFRECFHCYDKFLHVYVDIQPQLDTVGTVGVSILYSFHYFKHLYHRRFHNPPCRNPHVAIFFINDHIITYQGTYLHRCYWVWIPHIFPPQIYSFFPLFPFCNLWRETIMCSPHLWRIRLHLLVGGMSAWLIWNSSTS